jgi:hypothetical protein
LDATLPSIVSELTRLDDHRDKLLTMHRAGESLLDDRGATRIVEELLGFCTSRVDKGVVTLCTSA